MENLNANVNEVELNEEVKEIGFFTKHSGTIKTTLKWVGIGLAGAALGILAKTLIDGKDNETEDFEEDDNYYITPEEINAYNEEHGVELLDETKETVE